MVRQEQSDTECQKNQDHEILLEQKKLKKDQSNIFVYDTQIENVEWVKYLGILLDCKLKFHQHNDKVKKILQFCGVFFQLRKCLSGRQLIFAYKSYVQPIIQYGLLV